MRMKGLKEVIIISLLLVWGCSAGMAQEYDINPPGVVIHNAPAITHEYVGSPSIVIMPDGTYIASHDYFGKNCQIRMSIYPKTVETPGNG